MDKINKKIYWAVTEEFLGETLTEEECKESGERLDHKWYESNCTDFSMYAGEDWIKCLLFHQQRAINYLKTAYKFQINSAYPKIILDHGCGLGWTTLLLRELYPNSKIYGSNLAGQQLEYNQFILEKYPSSNIKFIREEEVKSLKNVDAIYAFELFEHIFRPVSELKELLTLDPTFLIESTSFTIYAAGHFPEYDIEGIIKQGTSAYKYFSQAFSKLNYDRTKTGFWNNRPKIWVKRER